MTLPNHVIGGVVFTGVFGGICGINILEAPGLILITVIAATLPDLDVPTSLWGRLFKPVSKWINRKFGHRTITHSLLFLIAGTAITAAITNWLESEGSYAAVYFLAALSHLVFDMMTVQGVPLLYPWYQNSCVIPGEAKLRLKSGNPRSELAVFTFFIFSGIFMQPLMENGFWTSYNRFFGTMKHLQSEFEKSEELLIADFKYREASQEFSGSGYVIECPSADRAVLWNEQSGWRILDGASSSTTTILEVIPTHTDRTFTLNRRSFVNISADSLARLTDAPLVYHLQLSANEPFITTYQTAAADNTSSRKTSALELDFLQQLAVEEIEDNTTSREVIFRPSPRIKTIKARIRELERKAEFAENSRREKFKRIKELKYSAQNSPDIYVRQRAAEELLTLEREVKKYETTLSPPYRENINELKAEIVELQKQDQNTFESKREAVYRDHQNKLTDPLRLTGIITLVEFSNPEDD